MIQVESQRDCKIVTVYGDVDLSALKHLDMTLGYVDLTSFLIVYFKTSLEVDPTVIGLLLRQHDARHGRLVIVAPHRSAIDRTLAFARVRSDRLSVVRGLAKAVAGIGPHAKRDASEAS